jgi:hypothetical protein
MRWLIWSVMLALTSGSGTLASRARNTPSLTYHGSAAMFSHGTFFISQLIGVDLMVEIIRTRDVKLALTGFLVYAGASTAGSLAMHLLAMRYFERGNRRVGTYEVES